MFDKLPIWYKKQTDTTKGFIWLALILIIGIIIRWGYISENTISAFEFLKRK